MAPAICLILSMSYLRRLDAAARHPGGWPEPQQIPTLSEVLDLAKGRAQVYIEIKISKRGLTYQSYPNIAERVIELVQLAGMVDNVLVISFDLADSPCNQILRANDRDRHACLQASLKSSSQ